MSARLHVGLTDAQFLANVARHQMTIVHEAGVHRHLHFREPGTSNRCFDLVTYPGFLVFSGDMGSFVFHRLEDMFTFFRREGRKAADGGIYTNEYYWAQKVEAACQDGVHEFDHDAFAAYVKNQLVEWFRSERDVMDAEGRRELREEVEQSILGRVSEYSSEDIAMVALSDFAFPDGGGGYYRFEDLCEVNFRRYSQRYQWACKAISWGIERYCVSKQEASKEGQGATTPMNTD